MERLTCTPIKQIHVVMDTLVSFMMQSGLMSEDEAISVSRHVYYHIREEICFTE